MRMALKSKAALTEASMCCRTRLISSGLLAREPSSVCSSDWIATWHRPSLTHAMQQLTSRILFRQIRALLLSSQSCTRSWAQSRTWLTCKVLCSDCHSLCFALHETLQVSHDAFCFAAAGHRGMQLSMYCPDALLHRRLGSSITA